jgi:xyloglucan-specific exo-beta-1,4-glucanase
MRRGFSRLRAGVKAIGGPYWVLYHIDGVLTAVTQIVSVQEVYAIGYGAPAPGQSYDALYLGGRVGDVQELFHSDDKGATWIEITNTHQKFDYVSTITGDSRIFGRVYFGGGGRGLVVGNR